MNYLRLTLIAVALTAFLRETEAAYAQTSVENPFLRFELELKKYDAAAIKAAQEQLDMTDNEETRKAKLESIKSVRQGIVNALKTDGQVIDDEVVNEFMDEFLKILSVEYADAEKSVSLLAFLESFTTEELVAMNTFYKSGIGAIISKKIPDYVIRLGKMRSQFSSQLLPLAFATARERLRLRGKLL